MSYQIISPTVTILDENGKIDLKGNKKVVEFLLENKISGLAPFGSTGEHTQFSVDEKIELIKLYVELAKGKAPVIAGTGNVDFSKTKELTKKAFEAGADGCLVLPPYYYALSQEEAYNWYATLASEVDGDIYIYNFPARTGFNIDVETVTKLVENYDNIAGLKDTVSDPEHTKELIFKVKKIKKNFKVYSGFDNQFVVNILSGGDGNISAFSNIVPELWAKWIKAAEDKNYEEVERLFKVFESLMPLYGIKANFPKLFKELMKFRGLDISTKSIFPYDDLSDEELERGKKIISSVID